ncbi:hypothetical protein MRX96_055214 [Rhipicephalus microplus]
MAGQDDLNPAMAECGTRGVLTSALLEKLHPCTVPPDNTCQIVDYLSTLKEVLFYPKLELQELPTTNGNMSLTSFADEGLFMPHDAERTFNKVVALVRQLLKTDSCIQQVHIHHGLFAMRASLICDALKCNLSNQVLNIDFINTIFNRDLDLDFDHVEELDELEHSNSELSSALSIVLRDGSLLSSLEVVANEERDGLRVRAALKENTTLRELSVRGSVICEAERGQFA